MRNIFIVNATQVVVSDAHPEVMMANGRTVMQESVGEFPDMTPEPEPNETIEE